MMSDSCSNCTLRRCIFSQIENGDFSRPATSTCSSPASRQMPDKLAAHLLDHVGALAAQEVQPRLDGLERIRLQLGERQRLQLGLHRVHADALGERRVDFHRLAGDALGAAIPAPTKLQRAHVVQPVGQLHQQHADVAAHRQHELAEILRLLGAVGLQFQPGQLGDAVHQPGDLGAEAAFQLGAADAGVLDDVVQQRGGDAADVQPVAGEDSRPPRPDG